MAANYSRQEERYEKLMMMIVQIQKKVDQMSDKSHISAIITNVLNQHFPEIKGDNQRKFMDGSSFINKEHESRILRLEELLQQLSKEIEKNQEIDLSRTSFGNNQDGSLLIRIQNLEQEIADHKAAFLREKTAKTSCEQADCVLQKGSPKLAPSKGRASSISHSSFGNNQDGSLLIRIQNLEQEIADHKAAFLREKTAKTSCEQADCVLQKSALFDLS
ncbi:SUN domain-containing protein 1-like [Bombina bombina]|uniref:SUN domain-containing protein 1-like n=1 Tax=Bombina bombina TaxID=8345 RepID=UPI00235AB367|nr:SUN domain-containing protein 1-like [Bombina bombina]